MNHLHRELAPISEAAWSALDDEATEHLERFLAARKLIEFHGPSGADALPTGRVEELDHDDVQFSRVVTVPMFEVRRPFSMPRTELEALERGATDVDFDPLLEAARSVAAAEDRMVFDGGPAGVRGLAAASVHDPIDIPSDYGDYPQAVAEAVATLRDAGVGGPYGIALGPRCYRGVIETTQGGYVVLDHLRKIVGGSIVWAPTVNGAVVVSMQGGDHHLEAAEDLALGYRSHDADTVALYLTETVGFRLDGDDAAVALRHVDEPAGRKGRSRKR